MPLNITQWGGANAKLVFKGEAKTQKSTNGPQMGFSGKGALGNYLRHFLVLFILGRGSPWIEFLRFKNLLSAQHREMPKDLGRRRSGFP